MNIEQQRAAFEAWASDHYMLQRNLHSDTYISVPTMRAWEAWQAAIALDRQGRGEPVAFARDGNLFWYGDFKRGVSCDLFAVPQPAEPVKVPSDLYPPMPDRSKWTLREEITSSTPIDHEGGPDGNETRYIITAAQLDRLDQIESDLLARYGSKS